MVENPHVDERQRVAQAVGDELVGLRRLGHARGVVVGEDHGGRVAAQRFLDHLAGVDGGAVDGAAKERHEFDDAVAVVEEEDGEDFVFAWGELELQVLARVSRVAERATATDAAREEVACGVQDFSGVAARVTPSASLVKRLFDMVGAP